MDAALALDLLAGLLESGQGHGAVFYATVSWPSPVRLEESSATGLRRACLPQRMLPGALHGYYYTDLTADRANSS